MKASLAAVFSGTPGEIELRQIPLPRLARGEVLVKVLGCTLCGSDLHSYEGRRKVPTPTILGHEIVGEIVELGDLAPRQDTAGNQLKLGDRVTWAIVANCGQCQMCQSGLPQKCLKAIKYGHEAFRPDLDPGQELLGGLAEYCLLVKGTSIVQLPETLPLSVACPASCATATIFAAVDAAGGITAKHFCLFGAGMLGLTACAVLRALGAASILCVDPVESRRDLAREFGATHVAAPDQLPELAPHAHGGSGFDAILELSGSNRAFEAGWPLLRVGGTIVLVGAVFPGAPVELSLEQVVRRLLTIRGVHNYAPRHLEQAIEFLTAHHQDAPFASLVSRWYPLREIELAFSESRRNSDVIRVGIAPA